MNMQRLESALKVAQTAINLINTPLKGRNGAFYLVPVKEYEVIGSATINRRKPR